MAERPNLSGDDFHLIAIGKIEIWLPRNGKFMFVKPADHLLESKLRLFWERKRGAKRYEISLNLRVTIFIEILTNNGVVFLNNILIQKQVVETVRYNDSI